jgi:hypothetical protein
MFPKFSELGWLSADKTLEKHSFETLRAYWKILVWINASFTRFCVQDMLKITNGFTVDEKTILR